MDWKYKALVAAGVAVVVFLAVCVYGLYRENAEAVRSYEHVRLENAELEREKDSLGREIARFEVTVLTHDAVVASRDSTIDSLRKVSSDWESLYLYVKAELETRGEIEATVRDSIVYRDSVVYQAGVFDWHDQWLTLKGTHVLGLNRVYIDYELRNSFSMSYGWKKTGLFSSPVLEGRIVNDNPNTTVGQVMTFTVPSPEKRVYEKWWFQLGTGFIIGGIGGYLIGR